MPARGETAKAGDIMHFLCLDDPRPGSLDYHPPFLAGDGEKLFGESPSETLRRPSEDIRPSHMPFLHRH